MKGNSRCVVTQDSIDLFLGNYAVDEADWATPMRDNKDWKFLTVKMALEDGWICFSSLSLMLF